MMKSIRKYISVAALGLFVALFAMSCGANPFIVFIGADQTGETAIYVVSNTAESGTRGLEYDVLTANPTAATDQTLAFEFLGGVVDSDTVATGILVYPLSDAAAATSVYVRGTALVPTSTAVVPNNVGDSIVRITVDLSGATISDLLEVAMDPAILTANGGLIKLNQDGDAVSGEAQDDAVVAYITVGGAPTVVLATGVQKIDPQTTVTAGGAGMGGFAAGAAIVTMNASNTSGAFDSLTADSVASSFVFRKFAFDTTTSTWSLTAITDTPTYDDTTGVVSFALTPALANLDVLRVDWDRTTVAESAAYRGFIHKGTTDVSYAGSTAYYGVGTFEDFTGAAITPVGGDSSWYIDIAFTGTELIESTISTSSIRLYNVDTDMFVPASMIAGFVKTGALTIRIEMAESFVPGTGETFQVIAYPLLNDDNGTPADTTDDRAYGAVAGNFIPGTASGAFAF